MPRFISGRSKLAAQTGLTSDRYRYLSVSEAEPNLGDPIIGSSAYDPNLVPPGQQYIVVSVEGQPAGERYWIPNQGGIIPGSISVFEESVLVGGLSSTTQLNFIGRSITAEGIGLPNPGVAVTISVSPPGNENEILFVSAGSTDFDTDTRFTFDDGLFTAGDRITVGAGGTVITTTGIGSIGIGVTEPTQKLHLDGNLRITGSIYDSLNQSGNQGDLIVKGLSDQFLWVAPNSVQSGAGGTIGQIQFHNIAGLVDGADNFYYDFNNQRVGIGSTQPTQLLDVLGVSTFSGGVFVDTIDISGITTFKNKVHFLDGDILNIGTDDDLKIFHDGSNNYIQFINGNLILKNNAADYFIGNNSTGAVQLNFNNSKKFETTNVGVTITGITETQQLIVSGISSLGNVQIQNNKISTKSGTGNLILDADGTSSVQVNDQILVNKNTESTNKDSGSIITEGGIGVEKSVNIGIDLNVGGAVSFTGDGSGVDVSLASAGGITTTGGDLYVAGDLYVNDDITFDNLSAREGSFTESLGVGGLTTTSQLDVQGITTTDTLRVGTNPTVSITSILDEDDMSSDSDTALATQQSIKKFVEDTFTSQDLDFSGDTGSGSVDLDNQTFSISGTANEIETSASGQTLTIGLPNDITVARNLTVNGNTDLGNASSDTVTFNARVDSNLLPSTNGTLDFGGTSNKWNTIYANTFNGIFQGNADSATKLKNAREFSINGGNAAGDVSSPVVTFDGTANVVLDASLRNSGVTAETYGDNTNVAQFTVNNKGVITSASNVSINFSDANVATADSLSNSRSIAATGDITWNVDFKGHEDVTAEATLKNVVTGGTVGSSTKVGIVTFDSKGRITEASNVDIDFGNASVTKANNLANGAPGSIPYQSAIDTTAFLSEPDANGKILTYNNSTNAPVWRDLLLQSIDSGTDAILRLSDGTVNFDEVTITAGNNITIDNVTAGGFRIAAVAGAGLGVDASANDILSVINGQITADDAGSDKIVFWDESANKLAYLNPNTGLRIDGSNLNVTSDAGKTYDLIGDVTTGSSFGTGIGTIILRENSDSTTDDIFTITAGANVKIVSDATGFTISAQDTDTITTPGNGTITINQGGVQKGTFTVNQDGNTTINLTDSDTNTTYDLVTADNGNDVDLKLESSGTDDDTVTIVAGDNITLTENGGSGFTIDVATGAGITFAASANDIFSIINGEIVADDPGEDRIIFWDDSSGKLSYLIAGDGLVIDGTTLNATSTANIVVDYTGRTAPCTLPITVSEPATGTKQINIPSNSNAFGAKYVQTTEPTGSSICDGDIWYDTSNTVGSVSLEPVGTIVAWGGPSANIPVEYQLCDGSVALTSELQAITGTNVPDLRDKFIVGASDSTGDTSYPGLSPGAEGGSASATLVLHSHTVDNHRHSFSAQLDQPVPYFVPNVDGDTDRGDMRSRFSVDEPLAYAGVSGNTSYESPGTNQQGSSATNKNLPPYYALCYIIKHTFVPVSLTNDKIEEGDTKAEVIDTSTQSKFTVEIDTAEKFSVDIGGPKIHRQDNSNEGGSIVFNRAADDVGAFEIDVYGSSNTDSGRLRILDQSGSTGVERFEIGPAGQIGLSGANYGTSGQVLTSNGSGSAPTWQTVSGGGGGGSGMSHSDKTGAYTLTSSDDNTLITTTSNVTIPSGVFSPANGTTIYNNSASSIQIIPAGGVTLRLSGSNITGTRTLAQRGVSTVLCVASNEFIITGTGLA